MAMRALRMEDLTVGEQLRIARQHAGLSQRDLAEAIGVGVRTLVRYEADERPIPSDVLHRIGQVLELSMDWLLSGSSQATPPYFADKASRRSTSVPRPTQAPLMAALG